MRLPGLIVAAPASGAGKTTITLALLIALKRRGVRVAAAKSGPDYLDPAFHQHVLGAPGVNLDSWAMSPALGLLSHSTSFARRRLRLGYRSATLLHDACIGKRGETFRGHKFHYSSLIESGGDPPLATFADATGASLGAVGARRGGVSGGFFHVIAKDQASPFP